MSDDLIEALRLQGWNEAADRMEQLEREMDGIRKAAWIEALDAAHEYTLTQYNMEFLKHPVDRERILALIGETK